MLKGGGNQAAIWEEEESLVVAEGQLMDTAYGQDKPEGERSKVANQEVCLSPEQVKNF